MKMRQMTADFEFNPAESSADDTKKDTTTKKEANSSAKQPKQKQPLQFKKVSNKSGQFRGAIRTKKKVEHPMKIRSR